MPLMPISDRRGYHHSAHGDNMIAMRDTDSLPGDHDSPWKEALSLRFPEFLALLFPKIHEGIDWSRGHDFLDTELQQVAPDAETGRRYADKLVKVCTLDGIETWVLIHVEVQGEPESAFAERMYSYHYRLFDRYRRDVVSLAVLADDAPGFRPRSYQRGRWGCGVQFWFPVVKLMDWRSPRRWRELEVSDNVFALVVMAQILAKATRDMDERKAWKIRLIRLMFDRDYERVTIMGLFRIIDWMIRLPEGLERALWREIHEFEESKAMAYVTSVERFGIEKGLAQGRQQGEAAVLLRQIELKFGVETAQAHRDRIEQADADTLLIWSGRILTAGRVEDIFDT